jgi:hypothetical protein
MDYYVYGTEKDTASAKYVQPNESTNLRKPPLPKSKDKSSGKVPSAQTNPEKDSFKISPIYDDSKDQKAIATANGKSSNLSLSGSDERDFNYLGSEEKDSEQEIPVRERDSNCIQEARNVSEPDQVSAPKHDHAASAYSQEEMGESEQEERSKSDISQNKIPDLSKTIAKTAFKPAVSNAKQTPVKNEEPDKLRDYKDRMLKSFEKKVGLKPAESPQKRGWNDPFQRK